ncbi:hypothetical protein QVD17_06374 [Tagetes erecta]|uniref:F-box/LRR-repeat protein 15/At3g58940/PEG3-like LRR domain-containing protein n=1 Tax=Tagetes erecta TaxID=13708 RepID=A0AAD8LNA7_TARER|nr:hypothetical protein QVD17_06374 [Tagetes erecta]
MSLLSKTWFNLTASLPVLDFNIRNFTNASRQSFFKYVEYATSRFCLHNVAAHRLKIITTLQEPAELDILNTCVESLLKKGVTELAIGIGYSSQSAAMPKYRLPDILLSVSMLKSLTIRDCDLPSSFIVDDLKFKSLIRLTLENVTIDDKVIKHLTTTCPLLQVLQIRNCYGFKIFGIYGHQSLEKVFIMQSTRVERIDIEAPNLAYLLVADKYGRGSLQMNLTSCKQLTRVSYFGYLVTNSSGCSDFLSNFPFVENLFLVTRNKGNNLKLSSPTLKTLVLHSNYDLENIEFTTPNLVLFVYSSSFCLLRPQMTHWLSPQGGQFLDDTQITHLKSCMQCYVDTGIDALWFSKLRLFLGKKNGFKVLNLYIHTIYSQKFKELENVKAIELPAYELEHVELRLDTNENEESSYHVAFVDAVLWCCRPRSLTLTSSSSLPDYDHVVKFTYEKLLQQENQGHTKIQMVSHSCSEAERHLKSLSRGKTINFIKKEDTLFIS